MSAAREALEAIHKQLASIGGEMSNMLSRKGITQAEVKDRASGWRAALSGLAADLDRLPFDRQASTRGNDANTADDERSGAGNVSGDRGGRGTRG